MAISLFTAVYRLARILKLSVFELYPRPKEDEDFVENYHWQLLNFTCVMMNLSLYTQTGDTLTLVTSALQTGMLI